MSENQTNDQIQEDVQEQDINILKKVRIEKLDELKKDNKNPYEITKYEVTAKNAVIREKFEEKNKYEIMTKFYNRMTKDSIQRMIHEKEFDKMTFL